MNSSLTDGPQLFTVSSSVVLLSVFVPLSLMSSVMHKNTQSFPAKNNNVRLGVNTLADNCVTSEFEKNHTFGYYSTPRQ